MADEKKPAAVPETKEEPAWKGTLSVAEPIVAPDGHVSLSQEDIDARDQ